MEQVSTDLRENMMSSSVESMKRKIYPLMQGKVPFNHYLEMSNLSMSLVQISKA